MDLAKIRQPAYQSLWAMMETVSISRAKPLTPEDRQQFDDDLTSYYYKDGHALLLSISASDLLLKAKGLLRKKPLVTDKTIRHAFSELRTQMKRDLAVYSADEAQFQIGPFVGGSAHSGGRSDAASGKIGG